MTCRAPATIASSYGLPDASAGRRRAADACEGATLLSLHAVHDQQRRPEIRSGPPDGGPPPHMPRPGSPRRPEESVGAISGGLRVFRQIGTEIAERADGGRCARLEAVAQRLEHHHAAAGLAV